jgi:dephospho-CoA kinase
LSLGWEAGAPSDAQRAPTSSLGWEAAEADARLRLAHQIPDTEKAAQSDYVLDNSGTLEALRAQVEVLWKRLKAESTQLTQPVL